MPIQFSIKPVVPYAEQACNKFAIR